MKQSLTYYITLFVIKLKGLKKDFSKDPIEFKKIRKEDVHYPKGLFFKRNILKRFKISDTLITEISLTDTSKNLIIFIHGGAFISGPAQHHWNSVKEIVKQTNSMIWMCDYPKSPENKINKISNNLDLVYKAALKSYPPNRISFIGDSVGGTLVISLTQRLIKSNIELPSMIILVSPVMDASLSNPEIEEIDNIDPMLSIAGVLSAKKMCAGNYDLKNEILSPLYGSFDEFPKTILFVAENDITYPDQKLAIKKFIDSKTDFKLIVGKNMPHIWPFLPIMKEAKTSLNEVINMIKTNHNKG